jgi:hypothetical protein
MNDSENIKALIPVVCPHCSKTLVVEFLINANLLSPESAEEILKKVDKPIKEEENYEPEEETEENAS